MTEISAPPPAPLHIKAPGVAQLLLLIALAIPLCGLCVYVGLHDAEQRVACVLGMILFGGCSLFLLLMLRRAGEIIYTIDEAGVHFTDTHYPMIPWRDIVAIKSFSTEYQRYIGLELRNEKEYFRSLSLRQRLLTRLNAMVGFPSVCLNLRDKESQRQCVAVCTYWLERDDVNR